MRNPGDDVRLSDGEMFCVGSVLYDEHVRITPEKKQVRPKDGFFTAMLLKSIGLALKL